MDSYVLYRYLHFQWHRHIYASSLYQGLHLPAVQSTRFCSLRETSRFVLKKCWASIAPVTAKAQQELRLPWFFTRVTACSFLSPVDTLHGWELNLLPDHAVRYFFARKCNSFRYVHDLCDFMAFHVTKFDSYAVQLVLYFFAKWCSGGALPIHLCTFCCVSVKEIRALSNAHVYAEHAYAWCNDIILGLYIL